jgi:hypothetical protein
MMYFAVLLLDTKKIESTEENLWDVEEEENTGLNQWMHLATPLLSLLFFLLTGGLVAGTPRHHTCIDFIVNTPKHCNLQVQMGDVRVNKKSDDKSKLMFTCHRCSVCGLRGPVFSL